MMMGEGGKMDVCMVLYLWRKKGTAGLELGHVFAGELVIIGIETWIRLRKGGPGIHVIT